MMEKASVTLTKLHYNAAMRAIEAGEYASLSEVIRDALREWERKRQSRHIELEALRAEIAAGMTALAEGRVQDFDAGDIIRRGRERLAAKGKS